MENNNKNNIGKIIVQEVKSQLKVRQNRNPEGEPKNRNEKKSTTAEEERGLSNDEIKIQRAAKKYYSQPGGPHSLSSQAEARAAEVKELEALEDEEAATHENTSAAPKPVAEEVKEPPAPVEEELEEEEKRYNAGSPASDGIGAGQAYTLEEFKEYYGQHPWSPLKEEEIMKVWDSSKVEKRYIGDVEQKDTDYTDWPWCTKNEFIKYYKDDLTLEEINNKWNGAQPWTNINAIKKAIDLEDEEALNKAIQEAEIVVKRIREINQMYPEDPFLKIPPNEHFINLIEQGKDISNRGLTNTGTSDRGLTNTGTSENEVAPLAPYRGEEVEVELGGGRKKTRRNQSRRKQSRRNQNRRKQSRRKQNKRKQSRRNQSRRKQNKRKQSRKRRN